jgi:serine/threonine-protein kinase
LNPGLVPVQVSFGRVQGSQGNYDLAFGALERALAIDPNDAMANQALAHLNGQIGRNGEAESLFRKAITLEPDNLYILDDYGNFLNDRGRYDEAIQQWQTIIRIAPDFYSVIVNMGSALVAAGRMSEAITILDRANSIQPTYMAYANLGAAYGQMKRYPESVEALEKALEFNQENWLAWGNIAQVYSWMDDADTEAEAAFNKAIELAEAAREQNNRDHFIYMDLAIYYAKTNRQDLAYQHLESALALAPESADVFSAAVEVYEIFGERERAVEMIRKAVDAGYPQHLFYRNPELENLLQTVEI